MDLLAIIVTMAVPSAHLRQLKRELVAHRQRLEGLEASIRAEQAEAGVHRRVLQLGEDERLLRVIDALASNERTRREAAKAPAAFFRRRGFSVPRGTKIAIDADTGAISATFKSGFMTYELAWDQAKGFNLTDSGGASP